MGLPPSQSASEVADAAISELNERFREHGVGYQFENDELMRVDSQLLHADVVKRALALLRESGYRGAEAEFLAAHEHYRHGRSKDALTECLKSLESVMKIICAKRKWKHDPRATAKPLLDLLFGQRIDRRLLETAFLSILSVQSTATAWSLAADADSGSAERFRRNYAGKHGQGFTRHSWNASDFSERFDRTALRTAIDSPVVRRRKWTYARGIRSGNGHMHFPNVCRMQ